MTRGGAAPRRSRRARIAPGLALPVAIATAGGTALIGVGALTGMAHAAPPPKNGKVTLCHATPPASAKNGWVQITVSTNAVTHAGHGQHADDIIPAFTYYVKRVAAQYPGKNLGTTFAGLTGAQILADGCRLPARPSSEPPTTQPAPSSSEANPVVSAPASSEPDVPSSAPATTEAPPSTEPTPSIEPTQSDEQSGGAPSSADAGASYSVVATTAVRPAGGRGAAPAAAVHAGLAAGDTGDSGGLGDSGALTASIVAAAVAALGGLGGLAYWRRRREGLAVAGDGSADGPGTAG